MRVFKIEVVQQKANNQPVVTIENFWRLHEFRNDLPEASGRFWKVSGLLDIRVSERSAEVIIPPSTKGNTCQISNTSLHVYPENKDRHGNPSMGYLGPDHQAAMFWDQVFMLISIKLPVGFSSKVLKRSKPDEKPIMWALPEDGISTHTREEVRRLYPGTKEYEPNVVDISIFDTDRRPCGHWIVTNEDGVITIWDDQFITIATLDPNDDESDKPKKRSRFSKFLGILSRWFGRFS